MALETGTKIADLVAANPASGDDASVGDDHLRLIKTVIRSLLTDVNQIKIGPASLAGKAGQILRVNALEDGFDELTAFVEGEAVTNPGSGTALTLAAAPNPASSLQLFRNGLLMRQGVGADYTVASAAVTLAVAIVDASEWFVAYYKI